MSKTPHHTINIDSPENASVYGNPAICIDGYMKLNPETGIDGSGIVILDNFRFYGGKEMDEPENPIPKCSYVRIEKDYVTDPNRGKLIITANTRFENEGAVMLGAENEVICQFTDEAISGAQARIFIYSPNVILENMHTFGTRSGEVPLQIYPSILQNKITKDSCVSIPNGNIPAEMHIARFAEGIFGTILQQGRPKDLATIICRKMMVDKIVGDVPLRTKDILVNNIDGTLRLEPFSTKEPQITLEVGNLNGNILAPGATVKLRNLPPKPENGLCMIHADAIIIDKTDPEKLALLNDDTYRLAMDWNVKTLTIYGSTIATNSAPNGLAPLSLAARTKLADQKKGCGGV